MSVRSSESLCVCVCVYVQVSWCFCIQVRECVPPTVKWCQHRDELRGGEERCIQRQTGEERIDLERYKKETKEVERET